MYLADYHTHTRVSPDSRASMLEMAAAAERAGLDEICFTDHFEPVLPRTTTLRDSYDWKVQTADYQEACQVWKGRVKLRLGLELGDWTVCPQRTEALLKDAPEHDFRIGSVHMLSEKFGRQDLAWLREPDEETCRREVEDYLETVLRMARWGQFTVLGHLTLPLRYMNGRRGFHISMDGWGAEMEEILKTLLQNGCGIEVNTNRGGEFLPGERWLRLYRKLGGEIVTLGSDAHQPQDVGRGIREGQELLKACGFSWFCTFERQVPIWHDL